MAISQLRIPTGPASRQAVTLDGVTIGLRLWWNARAGRWIVDIEDASGAEVASGIGLALGVSLWARFGARSTLPPGALLAVDTSGAGLEAGRDDLGTRVLLLYYDAAELAALASA